MYIFKEAIEGMKLRERKKEEKKTGKCTQRMMGGTRIHFYKLLRTAQRALVRCSRAGTLLVRPI